MAPARRQRGSAVHSRAPSASAAARRPPSSPCRCFQYCSERRLRYHRHSRRPQEPSCGRPSTHQRTTTTRGSPGASSDVTAARLVGLLEVDEEDVGLFLLMSHLSHDDAVLLCLGCGRRQDCREAYEVPPRAANLLRLFFRDGKSHTSGI
jgi:hypothetical protein